MSRRPRRDAGGPEASGPAPTRPLAEILADDPDLAAALKEIARVANQCRIIEVDDTKPAKKRAKKRAGKPKKP